MKSFAQYLRSEWLAIVSFVFLIACFTAIATLLGGCVSKPTPKMRNAPEVFTPATGKSKPSPSATITIIHIRPEARDNVHP